MHTNQTFHIPLSSTQITSAFLARYLFELIPNHIYSSNESLQDSGIFNSVKDKLFKVLKERLQQEILKNFRSIQKIYHNEAVLLLIGSSWNLRERIKLQKKNSEFQI